MLFSFNQSFRLPGSPGSGALGRQLHAAAQQFGGGRDGSPPKNIAHSIGANPGPARGPLAHSIVHASSHHSIGSQPSTPDGPPVKGKVPRAALGHKYTASTAAGQSTSEFRPATSGLKKGASKIVFHHIFYPTFMYHERNLMIHKF